MTKNNQDIPSDVGNSRIRRWFLSAFGKSSSWSSSSVLSSSKPNYSSLSSYSSSSSSFPGVFLRSLKDDYPLWIASMWLLCKQQQPLHNANKNKISDNSNNNFQTKQPSILIADVIVLGILLVYKKSRDEKYLQERSCRRDGKDDGNDNGNDNGDSDSDSDDDVNNKTNNDKVCDNNKNKNDTEVKKEETSSIDELRRMLKENSTDCSEQLIVPTMTTISLESSSSGKQPPLQPPPLLRTSMTPTSEKSNNKQRYLEMLVHNVSHTDLVLSLDVPPANNGPNKDDDDDSESESYCLCRPRFSAFDAYSQRLVDFMKHQQYQRREESLIRLPQYERNDQTKKPEPSSLETATDDEMIPIGFRLRKEGDDELDDEDDDSGKNIYRPLRVSSSELNDLRVRGRDQNKVANSCSLNINAVFFPLLATLIPLWQEKIQKKYASSLYVKQVVILVSGVGQPRNWTHSVRGNSTQQCAELMKMFLQTIYPDLIVVHIHSDTNIFRYDENIAFVQQELLPRVQEYRDSHAKGILYPDEIAANLPPGEGGGGGGGGGGWNGVNNSDYINQPFSTEWRKSFSVTLSFADGSPARNHAIQAALRTFKPTCYHFWQLKTFWHESKIVTSDIEVHSFEEMETLPPVETSQLHDRPVVDQVVKEMKRFRDDFMKILSDTSEHSNEIRTFWLRKTHKPVIAVLAVQTTDGNIKLYRGTNMEVSMPTGSLCAERNVIGTALADNPSLRRQDLKVIAVLAVPNPKQPQNVTSTGSGGIPRPQSTTSIGSMVSATLEDESSHGKFVSSRKSSFGGEDEWIVQDHIGSNAKQTVPILDNLNLPLDPSVESQSSTPVRRIYLYNKPRHQTRKQRRTVVVYSDADINPLRPCGACNEWLKKLAESNPYFTIVTFTDSECNGVYCAPCEE